MQSHSSKKGLTGSRKRPRHPVVADEAARALRLAWLDELDGCCDAIETLAGLLLACGDEELENELVRRTGNMIDQQIRQLRASLEKLDAVR